MLRLLFLTQSGAFLHIIYPQIRNNQKIKNMRRERAAVKSKALIGKKIKSIDW
jgi:hypothetical protein